MTAAPVSDLVDDHEHGDDDTTLAIAANQAATPQRGDIPDRVSARNTAGPSISTAPV